MEAYLAQLTKKEKIALAIAQRMLGSSFSLEKSIGYISFKKNNPLP
jgi:hypothetical protein